MRPIDVLSDGTEGVPKREKMIVVLGRENAGIALQLAVLMAGRENLRNEADRLEVRITLEADLQRIHIRGPGDVFDFEDPLSTRTRACIVESGSSVLSQAVLRSMSSFEGKIVYSPDRRKDNLNAQVNPYVPPGRSAAALRKSARKRR